MTDTATQADSRFRCFERPSDVDAFDASVITLLGQLQTRSQQIFVNEHNVLRMNHGGTWVHAARDPDSDVSTHTISAELVIPFKSIADNDLSLIARTIVPVNEEMEKQFAQNMYGLVVAAADKVGNAQPTELVLVLLRASRLFNLADVFDESLEALDHLALNAYLPEDFWDFGAEHIPRGTNAVFHIGHDVWTVKDIETAWPVQRDPAGPGTAITALLASLLFPDRTSWFLMPPSKTKSVSRQKGMA